MKKVLFPHNGQKAPFIIRLTADQRETPQTLPVLQEEDGLKLTELPPPENLDAKVESFLLISGLPHDGHASPCQPEAPRTSSSKG